MKASFGIPSGPPRDHGFDYLPECSRDQRHVGDRVWHRYYHMSRLSENFQCESANMSSGCGWSGRGLRDSCCP
uniref:Uncharacterized protein n=1 Tax=Setaria viridis TaxID=4556 RepID=A0A4U6U6X7_SETVI|nr:hypothetical protein SEVIR_6G074466v2 [Setaria viridis]